MGLLAHGSCTTAGHSLLWAAPLSSVLLLLLLLLLRLPGLLLLPSLLRLTGLLLLPRLLRLMAWCLGLWGLAPRQRWAVAACHTQACASRGSGGVRVAGGVALLLLFII
jgi:hypothetical protein